MQNDFIDGSLGTNEAKGILKNVLRKIELYSGNIIFTKDTHYNDYLNTQEGKILPVPHCLFETYGWELFGDLEKFQKEKCAEVYLKSTFGSVELARDLATANQKSAVTEIEIIGLCTDICVVSNALIIKQFLPEVPIYVDPLCCAGTTPEKHFAALKTLESCQVIL